MCVCLMLDLKLYEHHRAKNSVTSFDVVDKLPIPKILVLFLHLRFTASMNLKQVSQMPIKKNIDTSCNAFLF